MQQPTIWIVGGVDKGNDYSVLEGLVKQKVLGIVCLGKDNNKIKGTFGSIVESFEANTAEQAVQISYRIAKKGYNVLLSPNLLILIYLKTTKIGDTNLKAQ